MRAAIALSVVFASGCGRAVFTDIATGTYETCAIDDSQQLRCWGAGAYGLNEPPQRDAGFTSVAVGEGLGCALFASTAVPICWGLDYDGNQAAPPVSLRGLAVGAAHACGIEDDPPPSRRSVLTCWGCPSSYRSEARGGPGCRPGERSAAVSGEGAPEGPIIDLSAGYDHNCSIVEDGTLACWGADNAGETSPPAGSYLKVASGTDYSCALREDRTLACWGSDELARATPPTGEFASLSTGHAHACALDDSGRAHCWGDDVFGQATPPDDEFVKVAAGFLHTCGLRADGSVVCWGSNEYGESAPP